MKRPVIFAIEVVVAMFIALAGAWIASKVGRKMNTQVNSDIRAADAQERIAAALDRAFPVEHK